MSDFVISVEGLSKAYTLRHNVKGQARYITLRDVLAHKAKSLGKRLAHPFAPRPEGPTLEKFWALKDVSFQIKEGERVGIIGQNGAGKSTLLKVISRITEPTCGRIRIRGTVASLLEVGTGFHPELTGRENIFLNGAILGMSKVHIKQKFDEIVDFAGVEKFLDTPVKRYSSGMYVRLAFAVAAHLEPEILVVDEVLAVGDAAFQKKCLGKMNEVSRQGRTIFFVSHNMTAIAQLCNKGIWMKKGCVQQIGPAEEVIKNYLASDSMQVPERRWSWPGDAPGDERIRLLAGRILQHERISSVLDMNEPAQVEFEFKLLQNVQNVVTGINLYDGMGTCVFAHCDWRPNSLTAGYYRKRVNLPPQLLAEGVCSVLLQVITYEPDIPSVVVPDALGFEAIDSNHEGSVRGPYKGRWPGIVRIGLEWENAQPITNGGLNTNKTILSAS